MFAAGPICDEFWGEGVVELAPEHLLLIFRKRHGSPGTIVDVSKVVQAGEGTQAKMNYR